MVLVHRQVKSFMYSDPGFESFPLPSLLASLQAGKRTLLPSLSIPSHKRSARHAAYRIDHVDASKGRSDSLQSWSPARSMLERTMSPGRSVSPERRSALKRSAAIDHSQIRSSSKRPTPASP